MNSMKKFGFERGCGRSTFELKISALDPARDRTFPKS